MPDSPSWSEVLAEVIGAELDQLQTVLPGRVREFDRDSQTAKVEPLVRPNGRELPVVENVPVVFPGTYWDLDAGANGETGLLLVGQWDWRRWFRTGDPGAPETTGRHALANAAFLPGVRPRPNLRTLPADCKVVDSDDLRLGDHTADDKLVIDDFLTRMFSFLNDLDSWVDDVDTACGPLTGTANLKAEISAMRSGITAGDYETVKTKAK